MFAKQSAGSFRDEITSIHTYISQELYYPPPLFVLLKQNWMAGPELLLPFSWQRIMIGWYPTTEQTPGWIQTTSLAKSLAQTGMKCREKKFHQYLHFHSVCSSSVRFVPLLFFREETSWEGISRDLFPSRSGKERRKQILIEWRHFSFFVPHLNTHTDREMLRFQISFFRNDL